MNRILRAVLIVVGLGAAFPLWAQGYEALLANLKSVIPMGRRRCGGERRPRHGVGGVRQRPTPLR